MPTLSAKGGSIAPLCKEGESKGVEVRVVDSRVASSFHVVDHEFMCSHGPTVNVGF